MKNPFRAAVLFDIDGTLLSTAGAGRRAFVVALRERFGIEDDLRDIDFAGRTDPAIVGSIFEKHDLPDRPEILDTFFRVYLRVLDDLIRATSCRLHPGVGELLDRLDARGDVLLGLLTGNIEGGARIKVKALGIDRYFRTGGYGSDDRDRALVALAARRRAERIAGRSFEDSAVFVVGDTPHDVRCARAIRAVAVAVATGGADREELERARPDLLLDDLSDSGPLLRLLDAVPVP